MEANFTALAGLEAAAPQSARLDRVREATRAELQRHRGLLEERLTDGSLRECHGDLHLSNLVRLADSIRAFDCIEFDPLLRWIDTWSDLGFLFMDCLVRDRAALGHAFVDGYLDESGDYQGAMLLPLYAAYRSMVRAKVAALRYQQDPADDELTGFKRHLDWAEGRLQRRPGRLLLMCGLSGSGKSWLATRLVEALPALRFRSDVARKRAAGLEPRADSGSGVGSGLYTAAGSAAAYARLLEVAAALLASGDTVIIDAAFLQSAQRAPFLQLAERVGAGATILHCDAAEDILRQRVAARTAAGNDPSEANLAVLDHQFAIFEKPAAPEPVRRVLTSEPLDDAAVRALVAALA